MKIKLAIFIFVICLCSIDLFSQEHELRDEFQILPCGDFMARIDNFFQDLDNSPNSIGYVVYYGGRYRKKRIVEKGVRKIKLHYAHQNDGLNYAKAIPLYIEALQKFSSNANSDVSSRIVLINGGYAENTLIRLWAGSKTKKPVPSIPSIPEKLIPFKAKKPLETPNYARCYEGV